jgi:hypothetical protein
VRARAARDSTRWVIGVDDRAGGGDIAGISPPLQRCRAVAPPPYGIKLDTIRSWR